MFGEATTESRRHSLCSSKVNWKIINLMEVDGSTHVQATSQSMSDSPIQQLRQCSALRLQIYHRPQTHWCLFLRCCSVGVWRNFCQSCTAACRMSWLYLFLASGVWLSADGVSGVNNESIIFSDFMPVCCVVAIRCSWWILNVVCSNCNNRSFNGTTPSLS